ncbi:o-succinylbenzoate synthase [bacterium]|nr:o-succinylbenzoate synthase [bacterium]
MAIITGLQLYRVNMPLVYPFRTAFGNDAAIESVLVRMEADGLVGWGETAPWRHPAYSPECAAGVFLVIREFLAPLVLGQDIASGDELQRALAPVKGNPFAKAGLDLAWWDLHAQRRGQPLWQVIGGRGGPVDVGADFGIMENIDRLLTTIEQAVRQGFKRVKLKYRPGWELEVLEAVRRQFPQTVFHVDCNSAYTLADTPMLRELDRFGLAMVEQPLMHDDLVDHAALQRELKTPICLDESITSPDKARQAIQLQACGWVNIKAGRVGGITNALTIHNLCHAAGIPCWIGGMLESAVGQSHSLALASLPNIRYPSDIFPTSRFYQRDLARPAIALSGPSQMTLSNAPGVGAAPDPEMLAAWTVDTVTLRV